ncbi:DMT family transporter [Palleronia sp. KMU-117]|uniref:DMT family transporter n=1 Tax=Palleronia sp. KMU-117 TaxID=3434108 RepID=UPI003D730A35
MTGDRPVLGILLMLGFCVLAPLADSVAKILGAAWPVLTLLAARFGVQAVVLLPLALRTPGGLRLSPRGWRLTVVRTVIQVAGVALFFQALKVLPLADAVAIAYVFPFLMLFLGKVFLGEEVGSRRLLACAVGFAGTLLVVQPSFVEVGAAAFLPMGVAVIFALFMLVTRQLSREADPISLQAITGGLATLCLVPAVLILGHGGPVEVPVRDLALLVLLGLIGTGGHLLLTWSLRFAPAATVAPMQYLEIPIATFIGWMIFRDFPNGLALAGIAVTMAAGLYIIARERRLSRRPAPPSPAAASPAAE